jgi:hypothetical protein
MATRRVTPRESGVTSMNCPSENCTLAKSVGSQNPHPRSWKLCLLAAADAVV